MSEQTNYKHVRATLTAAPAPLKTEETPEYDLDHYTVRRYRNTVIVELHSEQGKEKRVESIFLPALAGVTDAELVRAAACFSPNKWNVSFSMDISQFGRKFYQPLEEPLLSELTSTSPMVLDRSSSQPPSPPRDEASEPAPVLLPQQLPSPVAQPVKVEQQS
ncbi:MAG TPA: hypothetical protein VKR83_09410, partial [Ktedonobacteraceae bacterium]|nr:hypothetical protein [Ktedonobacteraceae bacterium]